MTEKEIEEYIDRKIKEIKKETECDDCILFIGKDSVGKMCAGINNEENLVLCAYQVIKAFGELGKNPYTRQTLLLRELTQHLINEVKEESGMVKRISKRGKPEAEDDPSVEK